MKIHWHFDNPWRDKAIYVPLAHLVPINHQRYQADLGDKLDAYLLPQPDGTFVAGIRYGKEGEQYISPSPMVLGDTRALAEIHRMQWRPCRWDDELTRPTEPGCYMLRIAGDCETDGPHVYYDYPDYTQSGRVFGEDGEVFAYGDTDEEPEQIIAWYGPLTAPPCDCY
ncbi:hypothetical protein V1279_002966 [Bradyrhizobium sp. AZCC 1610]|uniref:hypothetical protein n=1 Tax=Bradyrhizobium sp. AZCC 1610 TaxID=3117020 RepID=UPI002FF079DC